MRIDKPDTIGTKYGIYNTVKREFQFHICANSKDEAYSTLRAIIGDDANKYRFEARQLTKEEKESVKRWYCIK